jgi:hypothetical protein
VDERVAIAAGAAVVEALTVAPPFAGSWCHKDPVADYGESHDWLEPDERTMDLVFLLREGSGGGTCYP